MTKIEMYEKLILSTIYDEVGYTTDKEKIKALDYLFEQKRYEEILARPSVFEVGESYEVGEAYEK